MALVCHLGHTSGNPPNGPRHLISDWRTALGNATVLWDRLAKVVNGIIVRAEQNSAGHNSQTRKWKSLRDAAIRWSGAGPEGAAGCLHHELGLPVDLSPLEPCVLASSAGGWLHSRCTPVVVRFTPRTLLGGTLRLGRAVPDEFLSVLRQYEKFMLLQEAHETSLHWHLSVSCHCGPR